MVDLDIPEGTAYSNVNRERGEVTDLMMAEDLDISPLAAEIILQALRPMVLEYEDIEVSGESTPNIEGVNEAIGGEVVSAIHVADSGLFVAMGQPTYPRYQAARSFALKHDLMFVIPESVYDELTVHEDHLQSSGRHGD